ncbi:hypothetical protein EV210_10648 [Anaerospora hongkongensis]|uniref:Uncharacterized protein n=1 Tax=Anaerospora hongkongensis TaxID=244830 RepID=A0A4R1PZQ4_9FIRM|nr:stage II sporulation protein P [Anaerospora hongkongensis]TCL37183.1 hypothetical protein EV210_10648 [Anaerospora hongkongensis]
MKSRSKNKLILVFAGLLAGIFLILGLWYYVPQYLPLPQQKQLVPTKSPYEYYIILDQATGITLMYVSVVTVNPGDEMITGENKRYVITRVEENRAYARYVEDVIIRTKEEAVP